MKLIEEFPEMIFLVFTNGTLLDEGMVREFKKTRNLIPVLSLEGYGEETDSRRGCGIYINLIKVMEVQYPLDKLWLVDGETFGDGTPIKRDVCVLDLRYLQGRRFGDLTAETLHVNVNGEIRSYNRSDRFLTDKVPRSLLNQVMVDRMPVYPVDWMCESYEFLSRPEVQEKLSEGLGASGIEKELLDR